MEARTTCFICFIKSLSSLLTKRKAIYEARTVNSHNSETVEPHCSRHFRAMKSRLLTNQNPRTIQIILKNRLINLRYQILIIVLTMIIIKVITVMFTVIVTVMVTAWSWLWVNRITVKVTVIVAVTVLVMLYNNIFI